MKTRSVRVTFFRENCKGTAHDWIESCLVREPGLGLMAAAQQSDAPKDWDAIYAHLRMRILTIGAVDYEEVQEKVEREWKNVMVTDRMDKASLQKSITDISKSHQKMTEVGLFTSGTSPEALASQEKLMRDLKRKVKVGSQLRLWLSTKEYEAPSFDQWIALIQHFMLQIPDGKEGAKALTDGDFGSSNTLESIKAGAEESGVGPEGFQ